jgi:hypothetical protein
MMEHRYSQRFKSHLQVLIYERGIPVSTGIATNSSRYGFFVDTNHPVTHNQPLEIETVDRSRRASGGSHRMKCYVVHSQKNGFGVEVDETHINEFSAIAAMRALANESNASAVKKYSSGA